MAGNIVTDISNYSYKNDWNKIYSSHYKGLYVLPWLGASFDDDLISFVENLPRNSRIIDIACGDGALCDYLSSHGFTDVLGIDVSDEIISRHQDKINKPGIRYEVMDVFDLPDNQVFDVVICRLLLHHIRPDDEKRLLLELNSIINPNGGMLFFSFLVPPRTTAPYIERKSYFTDEHNVVMYNPEYVKQTLKEIGVGELIKEGEYVMSNDFYSDEYQVLIYKKM
jgi:2-polyprenyl-3-methyl-5-hydroxy-6-metoxy-1,4-benzoquinol methylase